MDESVSARSSRAKNRSRMHFRFSRDVPIYGLLLPAVLLLLVFNYIPIYGIVIGFEDFSPYKGLMGSDWVGFANFQYFLRDADFWRVLRNTLVINSYQLIFGFPVPIIFAILLNELYSPKFKKVVQTVSYLPYFISWVVAASIVISVLSPEDGFLNNIRHMGQSNCWIRPLVKPLFALAGFFGKMKLILNRPFPAQMLGSFGHKTLPIVLAALLRSPTSPKR